MPVTPPAPPDLSKLPHVTTLLIQFQTTGDDKDSDTVLTVSFLHNQTVLATITPPDTGLVDNGFWGSYTKDDYSDGHTTPWIPVPLRGIILKADIPQCTTKVHIDPNGNDTWRFNYWVRVQYSDGSEQDFHFDGHALSQKVRDNTFPLK